MRLDPYVQVVAAGQNLVSERSERRVLADRAFHLELDQAAPLNRVLHGQGPSHRLDEAVDHHADGLFF